jgi:hypothetical protein
MLSDSQRPGPQMDPDSAASAEIAGTGAQRDAQELRKAPKWGTALSY